MGSDFGSRSRRRGLCNRTLSCRARESRSRSLVVAQTNRQKPTPNRKSVANRRSARTRSGLGDRSDLGGRTSARILSTFKNLSVHQAFDGKMTYDHMERMPQASDQAQRTKGHPLRYVFRFGTNSTSHRAYASRTQSSQVCALQDTGDEIAWLSRRPDNAGHDRNHTANYGVVCGELDNVRRLERVL